MRLRAEHAYQRKVHGCAARVGLAKARPNYGMIIITMIAQVEQSTHNLILLATDTSHTSSTIIIRLAPAHPIFPKSIYTMSAFHTSTLMMH